MSTVYFLILLIGGYNRHLVGTFPTWSSCEDAAIELTRELTNSDDVPSNAIYQCERHSGY